MSGSIVLAVVYAACAAVYLAIAGFIVRREWRLGGRSRFIVVLAGALVLCGAAHLLRAANLMGWI